MSSALVAGDAEDSAAPVEMGDLRPETGDRKSQSPESSDQRPATSHQSSVISGQQPATSIEDALIFRVLYLAHCTRDKGLFDTLDAVALANSKLKTQNSPLRIALTVAGAFLDEAEHEEFNRRIAQPDLMGDTNPVTSNQFPVASIQKPAVTCADFVSGEAKDALLRESDCYLFPTYYSAEAQPVSIIEAMAFGLPVISTRWRAIPDVLPVEYPCLIDIRDTARAAELLLSLAGQPGPFEELRAHFLKCYSDRQHIRRLRDALLSVEERIGRGHGDCAP
jgi:glycosyltransferase involved in cell wall biosynthesis